MSDRPTPITNAAEFPAHQATRFHHGEDPLVDASVAGRLERQRDEYAETLESVASGKYCGGVTKFIRERHPELAP
jgi:hypothetical protein